MFYSLAGELSVIIYFILIVGFFIYIRKILDIDYIMLQDVQL